MIGIVTLIVNFIVIYPSVVAAFFLVLFCAARWMIVTADRKRTEWLLVVAALSIPLAAGAEAAATALSRVRPLKFDEFIFQIDQVFGEPSFLLGRLVAHHATLHALVAITYGCLPVTMVSVFAVHLYLRSESEALRVLWIFSSNLMLALPLYLLCPVCGPAFAFAQFPIQPAALTPHMIAIAGAPNGVPSVHTSTALLVVWLLWPWKLGRLFGCLFLSLTVLATLGSGQHYFFDLVCAVPYAAAIGYCFRTTSRWTTNVKVSAEYSQRESYQTPAPSK